VSSGRQNADIQGEKLIKKQHLSKRGWIEVIGFQLP